MRYTCGAREFGAQLGNSRWIYCSGRVHTREKLSLTEYNEYDFFSATAIDENDDRHESHEFTCQCTHAVLQQPKSIYFIILYQYRGRLTDIRINKH